LFGRLDHLDAVSESDALDDFGQLVCSVEFAPVFGGCGDEFEDREPGGVLRQRALGSDRSVADVAESEGGSSLPSRTTPATGKARLAPDVIGRGAIR
jgi:hypothetical protein